MDVDLTELQLHWPPLLLWPSLVPPSSSTRRWPTARHAAPLTPTLAYRCNVMMRVKPCVWERLSDSWKDWEGTR